MITTLGCKLNYSESSTLGTRFRDVGYEVVREGEPADVIVVNTCSVTENADAECRKVVRKLLRGSPDAIVAITGCYAQLQPESVASIDGVRGVFGTAEKLEIPDFVEELSRATSPLIYVAATSSDMHFVPTGTAPADGRTRAFVKLQDGCDYSCSFCTIPLARGGSRSMPFADVVQQLDQLAGERFHEVILSGINLGEYQAPTGERLVDVLQHLVQLRPPYRVRVSSIEPNTLHDDVINALGSCDTFCPHVHVPLQSGSNSVLRRMRRRYTAERYRDVMQRLHATIPGLAVGIDVITGFPGETQAEFEETFSFLEGLSFTYLHVFTYSERPSTPAALFGDVVPMNVRRARTARLRALSDARRTAFYAQDIGSVRTVVTESYDVERKRWIGWTENYIRVAVDLPYGVGRCAVRVRLDHLVGDVVLATPTEDAVEHIAHTQEEQL